MFCTFTSIEVLDIFWDRSFPVNPIDIAHTLCMYAEASNRIVEISLMRIIAGVPLIQFNSYVSPTIQRFAVAHQIGHFALGHLDANKSIKDDLNTLGLGHLDVHERAATQFAMELLIPKTAIEHAIMELKVRKIGELAEAFEVSPQMVMYRLQQLGLAKTKT